MYDFEKITNEEFIQYLVDKKSKSPKSLYIEVKKINSQRQKKFEVTDFFKLIDIESLVKTTITYDEFKLMCNKITKVNLHGEKYNLRDIVTFKLGWYGIAPNDMIQIKYNDIVFNDLDVTITIDDKKFILNDLELMDEIKLLMTEKYYYIKGKKHAYRDSDYLCKPVMVGINKTDKFTSIYASMKVIMFNNDIKIDGKDCLKISFEDLKRSRICFLFNEDNSKFIKPNDIAKIMNLNGFRHVMWLKQLSDIIYRKEV